MYANQELNPLRGSSLYSFVFPWVAPTVINCLIRQMADRMSEGH